MATSSSAPAPEEIPFAHHPGASESDGHSSRQDVKGCLDEVLNLGGECELRITQDSLLYRESTRSANKRARTCCIPPGTQNPAVKSIPLYNILYVSTTSDDAVTTEPTSQSPPTSIIIDYADQTSPTRLLVSKLTIPIPTSYTPPDATTIPVFVTTLLTRSYGPAKPRKRAYVLVNPHAGPGGADRIWARDVKPFFDAARMPQTVVRTKYSGEAVTLVRDLEVEGYDCIIPCSGDGLPHEVFNGLASRPTDARTALRKLPVAHVPCGSGNAMSCNLYGTHRPSLAALAIVKGVDTPLDLVSITQGEKRTVSFLSQALGIVAESDLATENLRWMGNQRFTYGFLVRMFERKVYPCDVAIKVAIGGKEGVREHYKRTRSEEQLVAMEGGVVGASGSGSAGGDEVESAGGGETGGEDDDRDGEGLPKLRFGTVMDELPEGWEMVRHDKMGNFYCGNMAYMAPDANFFSAALANDGYMDLVSVDGDISPTASLKMLLSVESGHFFDNPLVSYRKVEAYRIIPHDPEGYISIDGERVPFEAFQAEVHRGLGRVLSKRGVFEAPGPKDWDVVTTGERLRA